MSKDYYKTLGIEKGADASAIKKAFHKLAHKYHPDKPDGDEAKFKEINEAYQVLSNPKKKAQYDQFGSAGPGFGGGGGQGFGGFDFSGFQNANGAQFDFGNINDIFEMFTGGAYGQRVRRGRDLQISVTLTFKESILGVQKTISVPDLQGGEDKNKNKDITVTIPAGVEHGQRVRMNGAGEKLSDGEPGNLYIQIMVQPHDTFYREGNHLIMNLEVKLTDAIMGGKYDVELLDGKTITVKTPKALPSGHILRVRGKGIPGTGMFGNGDLLIKTSIAIPSKLSKSAKKAIEALKEEGL